MSLNLSSFCVVDAVQNDEAVLQRRLHALAEDEARADVVRRCAVVLREIARHKHSGFFLFPVDRAQVSLRELTWCWRPGTLSTLAKAFECVLPALPSFDGVLSRRIPKTMPFDNWA